jgi:hypothetical protein
VRSPQSFWQQHHVGYVLLEKGEGSVGSVSNSDSLRPRFLDVTLLYKGERRRELAKGEGQGVVGMGEGLFERGERLTLYTL